MKPTHLLRILLACGTAFYFAACGGADEHAGHDHDPDAADAAAEDHDHDDDDDGDSDAAKEAGPNGGRLLTSIEPHAEFLVMEDGKVQITFLDADNQPTSLGEQSVTVVAGDRSNPTTLAFAKEGEALLSTTALPEGDDYPLAVTLQLAPASEPVYEKFTLDLSDCPTCEYREYACICDH